MTKHPEHICRFNDEPQSCECYDKGYEEGKRMERYALFKGKHTIIIPTADGDQVWKLQTTDNNKHL